MLNKMESLSYLEREVKKKGNVRSLDKRFFIEFRDSLKEVEKKKIVKRGEMEDIEWVLIEKIEKIDIESIKKEIMKEEKEILMDKKIDMNEKMKVVK